MKFKKKNIFMAFVSFNYHLFKRNRIKINVKATENQQQRNTTKQKLRRWLNQTVCKQNHNTIL